MRERQDRINNPTYSLKDFQTYEHLSYSGTIPVRCFSIYQDFKLDELSNPSRVDLANAYVFGEQILDRNHQTAVLETVAGV
jgi:hypothetical protein